MHKRCRLKCNASFERYGARGIVVCERWRSFENFLIDMGERPDGKTLDRIDNTGNYEKDNCRWATRSEQQKNKEPFKWKVTRANYFKRNTRSPYFKTIIGLGAQAGDISKL